MRGRSDLAGEKLRVGRGVSEVGGFLGSGITRCTYCASLGVEVDEIVRKEFEVFYRLDLAFYCVSSQFCGEACSHLKYLTRPMKRRDRLPC